MADTDETPATPKPPARRAPRKTSAAKPAAEKKPPAKPRAKRATVESAAPATPPAKKPAAPPKPRSSKRATPPTKRGPKPKAAAPETEAETKPGWKSKAALAGGLAAVGAAATAALLSLRGSTAKKDEPAPVEPETTHAHTADGTDATESFNAGIADEGVVPE